MESEPAKTLGLSLLAGRFAVCRLNANVSAGVPDGGAFFSVTRTSDELSVVCEESVAPEAAEVEGGWRALKVQGPFEFSETGVISSIVSPLADATVPVFVISTFDTDYLLVKEDRLEDVKETLAGAGHRVLEDLLIRRIEADDEGCVREMLTVAAPTEDDFSETPEISRYMDGWGREGDLGFVAEDAGGEAVGAAWSRLFTSEDPGYGFVDGETPELAIGVRDGRRGSGVGRALLKRLIREATGCYPAISLSVRDDNPAVRLYRRLGFEVVAGLEVTNRAGGTSFVMRRDLR